MLPDVPTAHDISGLEHFQDSSFFQLLFNNQNADQNSLTLNDAKVIYLTFLVFFLSLMLDPIAILSGYH
jgi:hypothetical protein